jgi:hypothetical protein
MPMGTGRVYLDLIDATPFEEKSLPCLSMFWGHEGYMIIGKARLVVRRQGNG